MTHRILSGKQSLLRIFVGDFDKYQHHNLYRTLVEEARKSDLAGCTVLLGSEGFGHGRVVHNEIAMECAGERPILIELVDEPVQITLFWKKIEPMLSGALVTEESVYVHHYQSDGQETPSQNSKEFHNGETNMDARNLNGEHRLLRVYVGESDKVGLTPLHTEILMKARKLGLAGCTTVRGVMGFGASSVVHKAELFRLSSDLPMVVEIVDTAERVHGLLKEIAPLLQGTLVTEEKVVVHHYSYAKKDRT